MIPYPILTLPHVGKHRHSMNSSLCTVQKAPCTIRPVLLPTFAFFCFNIGQIVPIRSLNLMFIQNINAVISPDPKIIEETMIQPSLLPFIFLRKSGLFFSNEQYLKSGNSPGMVWGTYSKVNSKKKTGVKLVVYPTFFSTIRSNMVGKKYQCR
jgi:hypothetical protein